MIASAGAGPLPIHHKSLNAENLSAAIQTCLSPSCIDAAAGIAIKMRSEVGVQQAVASFHKNLNAEKMRCDLIPSDVAVWKYKHKAKGWMKISAKATAVLIGAELIKPKDLKP